MEVAEQMKITDVNIDCLEKVLKYLNMKDLLSVADSTKHLREAAKLAFASKYRRLFIVIACTNLDSEPIIKYVSGYVDIQHTKLSLQTLRCFGDQISKLDIRCTMNTFYVGTMYERLVSYVSEYCVAPLTEIRIYRCPIEAWDQVQTPFLGIGHVALADATLNGHTLNRLFPKMSSLILATMRSFLHLNRNFPYLTIIQLGYLNNFEITKFECDEMAAFDSFIRLNQQIRGIKMPFMAHEYLQQVSNHWPLLEDLYLYTVRDVIQNTVHFKSVKRFVLYFYNNVLPRITVSLDGLEEFRLHVKSQTDIRSIHPFLIKNPTIKKFTILLSNCQSLISEKNLDISKLVSSLPSLKELDLSSCELTLKGAVFLMKNLKCLNKIHFTLDSDSEIKRIMAQAGREWQGSRLKGNTYRFVRE